jgi:hypothetical protein
MYAVVTGINNQLNALAFEKVAHGDITLLGRCVVFLRQLSQWNSALSREGSGATCRFVRRHSDHIESALDKVAQVRAGARNRHPQSHW